MKRGTHTHTHTHGVTPSVSVGGGGVGPQQTEGWMRAALHRSVRHIRVTHGNEAPGVFVVAAAR